LRPRAMAQGRARGRAGRGDLGGCVSDEVWRSAHLSTQREGHQTGSAGAASAALGVGARACRLQAFDFCSSVERVGQLSELADLAIAHGLLRGDAKRCIKDRMTFNWILNNDQFEVP